MNITTNPYAGYSQAQTSLFQYDAAAQQQQQKPSTDPTSSKYQDRVTFSGVGDNLTDFFFAGHDPQLQNNFAQQKKISEDSIHQHLKTLSGELGISSDTQFEIKKFGHSLGSFLVSGGGVEEMERLSSAVNSDAEFLQNFTAAEQIKKLSVAIASAQLRMDSLAKEGVVPQYQELQKIKERVEQQFLSVSLHAGQAKFDLID